MEEDGTPYRTPPHKITMCITKPWLDTGHQGACSPKLSANQTFPCLVLICTGFSLKDPSVAHWVCWSLLYELRGRSQIVMFINISFLYKNLGLVSSAQCRPNTRFHSPVLARTARLQVCIVGGPNSRVMPFPLRPLVLHSNHTHRHIQKPGLLSCQLHHTFMRKRLFAAHNGQASQLHQTMTEAGLQSPFKPLLCTILPMRK